MSKLFHEVLYVVNDSVDLRDNFSRTITSAAVEGNISDGQYFEKYENYFTICSDGTQKTGVLFDFGKNVIHGDMVRVTAEVQTVSGDAPCIYYEEYTDSSSTIYSKKKKSGIPDFEMLELVQYVPNRFGNKQGRVFIGLEVGQAGVFRIRFPKAIHMASVEYKRSRMQKMFQISKSGGTWTVDASTSYRVLDKATISLGAQTLNLNYEKPFKLDIPQIFISSNDKLIGHNVYFGYRAKDGLELFLTDTTGLKVSWNALPDGSIVNILAVSAGKD